jgi:hypothetical protein
MRCADRYASLTRGREPDKRTSVGNFFGTKEPYQAYLDAVWNDMQPAVNGSAPKQTPAEVRARRAAEDAEFERVQAERVANNGVPVEEQ